VSCCNPRGLSPDSVAVTAAVTVVLFVVCGGPLLRLIARLWDGVNLAGGWLRRGSRSPPARVSWSPGPGVAGATASIRLLA
jgi:hypothetical protein